MIDRLKTTLSATLANLLGLLRRVAADPLGVRPESPGGLATSAEGVKGVVLGLLVFISAHGVGIASVLGPTGTAIVSLAAALLQVARLFGAGPAEAFLAHDPARGGLGVVHPMPGDPAQLGFFAYHSPLFDPGRDGVELQVFPPEGEDADGGEVEDSADGEATVKFHGSKAGPAAAGGSHAEPDPEAPDVHPA